MYVIDRSNRSCTGLQVFIKEQSCTSHHHHNNHCCGTVIIRVTKPKLQFVMNSQEGICEDDNIIIIIIIIIIFIAENVTMKTYIAVDKIIVLAICSGC